MKVYIEKKHILTHQSKHLLMKSYKLSISLALASLITFFSTNLYSQSLDKRFSAHLASESEIIGLQKDSEGKLYILGDFKRIDDTFLDASYVNNLIRIDNLGEYDPSFKLDETLASKSFNSVQVYQDKILLVSFARNNDNGIDVLNLDGSIDTNFQLDNSISLIYKIEHKDGHYYAAAILSGSLNFVKLNSDGSLNSEFGTHKLDGSSPVEITILNDNKILVSGQTNKYDDTDVGTIFRVNSDGSLDQTFNTGTATISDGDVIDVEVLQDETILVSGYFNSFNGVSTPSGLVKLDANGAVVTAFNADGVINRISRRASKIKEAPDNKIYLAGGHLNDAILIRLNADGSTDQTYAAQAFSSFNRGQYFNIEIIGEQVIFANKFTGTIADKRLSIAQTDFSGNILPQNFTLTKAATAYAALPFDDGKVLVSGDFILVNGSYVSYLTKLNADGTIDSGFELGIELNSAINEINVITKQSDGKIILGGYMHYDNTITSIIRLNQDGSIDPTFSTTARAYYLGDNIKQITVLEDDGLLVAGGIINTGNNLADSNEIIVRLGKNGAYDLDFNSVLAANPQETNNQKIIEALAIKADGTYLVGGYFSSDGRVSGFINNLNTDGSLVSEFNNNETLTGSVNVIQVINEKLLFGGTNFAGGGFSDRMPLYQANLTGNELDDTTIGISDTDNFGFYKDLLLEDDGSILVAGSYEFINQELHSNLARIKTSGIVDNKFNVNFLGYLNKIERVDSENIFAVGEFSSVNGTPSFGIAKIKTVNSAPIIDGVVSALTTKEEEAITIASSDLLITDPENEVGDITISISEGANYTVSDNTITPVLDFNGTLTVPVIANDGELDSKIFNIEISVTAVNDAPIITEASSGLTTAEETNFTFDLDAFTVTDPDNSFPTDFSLTITGGDNYTIDGNTVIPNTDFNGTLTVAVKVNDGTDDSNSFNAQLEVTPVNDKPVIVGTVSTLITDNETPFTLSLTDLSVTDPDNNYPSDFTLSVAGGANYILAGNVITPTPEFIGTLTIPVKVNDGNIDSDEVNITLEVSEVTSIDLDTFSLRLDLFPNPTQNQLNIVLENSNFDDIIITITDLNGAKVYRGSFQKKQYEFSKSIDLSQQTDGTYFVEIVQSGKYRSLKKIIKN
ncbi:putative delta-60 repeat protein/predicted secreted protein (Por secretion system target) [Roseivirga ehrenbergii]|nr:putative delta-60 repeat protein/predicted secreted protein (Por secretion system target) [Roseivirga ehrenbergii]